MNDMKIIMEGWRKFKLSEQQPAATTPVPATPQQAGQSPTGEVNQLETYGQLKKLVKDVISGQTKGAIKTGLATAAIDQVLGFIPGASNAKSAFDFFKNIYSATDDKKTNSVLDKINVDDEYSKIVDDKVEMAFLKAFSDMIMSKSDNEPIPKDFNINQQLQDYLKNTFNQRTLTYTG